MISNVRHKHESQEADLDLSRVLSPREAGYLSLALSLDGLAVGFGAGLAEIDHLLIVLLSLVFNAAAVMLGAFIGNKIAVKLPLNLSWISGLLLVILGISKLL